MKDTVDRPGLKLAFAVARVRLKSTVGQQVSILPVLEWRYDNYQICLCTLAPSRAQLPVRRTFAWRIYSFCGVVWQPSCSAAKRRLLTMLWRWRKSNRCVLVGDSSPICQCRANYYCHLHCCCRLWKDWFRVSLLASNKRFSFCCFLQVVSNFLVFLV